MFNIINSYYNQKDTDLVKDNYLMYYCRLYPMHKDMFPSLFNLYANVKMEELRLTIRDINFILRKDRVMDELVKKTRREVLTSFVDAIICFLKCSNKSITNNTKESTKRLLTSEGQLYNNEFTKSITNTQSVPGSEMNKNGNVWEIFSNMAILESKFVVSRLYESITMTDKMLGLLWWIENCECFHYFLLENNEGPYRMANIKKFQYEEFHKEHYKNREDIPGNHLCMCSVICHLLYPNLIRCLCYLVDVDFDTLSTMSRSFDKHTRPNKYKLGASMFFVLVFDVFMKITNWMYQKYGSVFGSDVCGSSICFCRCPNDPYYKYFICIIISISFLVENMFGVDEHTIQYLVRQISSIYDQMHQDDSYYKRPKAIRLRNASVSCLSSQKHICGCTNGNKDSVCEVCKNCNVVCLSICLLCCMIKSFGSDGKCDVPKPCDGQTGDKCCICRDSDKISSCLKEISCLSNLGTNNCAGTLNSGCCGKICECIKQMSEKLPKTKDGLAECVLKSICGVRKCAQGQNSLSEPSCCIIIRYSVGLFINICTRISVMMYSYFVVSCIEYRNVTYEGVKNYIYESNIKHVKGIAMLSRANKMFDSSNEINNNKFERSSDNHYSYNDAYRINTSRAHGSLKYIIIKIVLILIIVVMTIFIRVKIETDDDYKMDNLLSEENGICGCSVENDNSGGEKDPVPYITNKHFQIALKNSRKSVEKSDVQLYESFKNKHME